jgi:hypothetical protein
MNLRFVLMLFVAVGSLLWSAGASLTAKPVVSGRAVARVAPSLTGFALGAAR